MSNANARDPAHRLLADGGRAPAMLGVMAIMLFLTVLAGGMGLATASASRALGRQLAGRVTVQIVEPDAAVREANTRRALALLRRSPVVSRAQPVDRATLLKLLQPWLGGAAGDPALPVPALIDVDLRGDPGPASGDVTALMKRALPSAAVQPHAAWMSPVSSFMAAVVWLAAAIVLLMAGATGAVVVLAARAGLDMHRETIEVLHMLGSTDIQVARLFQRRIGADTLTGGVIGTAAALVVIAGLGRGLASLQSELLTSVALGTGDWVMLAILPVLFAMLAVVAARAAVLKRLGRIL